jgi:YidC/Oxa1 family membrane protein insertase
MRHAPFIGWIQDLSAPDPLSVFNLFGLLPITLPSFLQVGPLPLLMGLTMLIQQKMSPQAAMDESQRKMMLIMPIMFTFLFSSFPAGLVLYWTLSNLLSIIQQYIFEKTAKV